MSEYFDILFAEIGSTKTMVSAFDGINEENPVLLGQGLSPTTIEERDVCIGLDRAISDLQKGIGSPQIKWRNMMATCSAAGGLRMAVHGLVKKMTSKAAKEAALGAGAIIVSDTYGILNPGKMKAIIDSAPNIVLLAGGVDGGEREKVLFNAEMLASRRELKAVLYAGNNAIRSELANIFKKSRIRLFLTENVYPTIDKLNVAPARSLIHQIFEDQLVKSPGMEKIKEMVNGPILPTPGAVMKATLVVAEELGDLMTLDVGGATTDVHSVTRGSPEIQNIQIYPEPYAKRTVEGDLGVFINAPNLIKIHNDIQQGQKETGTNIIVPIKRFPRSDHDINSLRLLTKIALSTAIDRHVGKLKIILTYQGEKKIAEGKDLTAIKWIIGTGGPLTRLERSDKIMAEALKSNKQDLLLPEAGVNYRIDKHYIMAAAGLMSLTSPKTAISMISRSIGGFK